VDNFSYMQGTQCTNRMSGLPFRTPPLEGEVLAGVLHLLRAFQKALCDKGWCNVSTIQPGNLRKVRQRGGAGY
jgi:hypothetical protein